MTPVQYIRGPSSTEGPEIIFELRVIRRNGAKDEQSEAEYFSVKRIMHNLFRPDVSDKGYPFGTLEIEVERATFVSQEVAYERDSFLKYIESFFAK